MATSNDLFNVLGLIVGVATITAVVSSPNSAKVISAAGSAFSGSIRAALGK
jgi:hypothetical protein